MKTLKLIQAGKQIDDERRCQRGLERLTNAGSRRAQRSRLSSIDAVMDEQDHQFESCCTGSFSLNERKVASEYRRFTAEPTSMAYQQGVQDAREAWGDAAMVQQLNTRTTTSPSLCKHSPVPGPNRRKGVSAKISQGGRHILALAL